MRDAGSITGKNISNMTKEFGHDPRMWSSKAYGQFVAKVEVPQNETWTVDLLRDMLKERHMEQESENSEDELEVLQFFIETLATI